MAATTSIAYVGLHRLREIAPDLPLDDPIIQRYEMIREALVTGRSPVEVAEDYGWSDTQYYKWYHRFEEGSILALQNQKPGPRGPRTIDDEVEKIIVQMRKEEDLTITQISEGLPDKCGRSASPATINRILDKHGLPKKKRGRKPKSQRDR